MWMFIVFVCVTVTAIIIFVNYRRTKKTMDTIEEMLNVAVKGEFTEGQFDETRMSALEAVHSQCQPGKPLLHGLGQRMICSGCAHFHRAKSAGLRFSL